MKDEIASLIADFGEFTLDSFIQDGIIKDLPIVGSAFNRNSFNSVCCL